MNRYLSSGKGPRLIFRCLAVGLVASALHACESTQPEDAYQEKPVEDLYNGAMDLLLDGLNRSAAKAFDEVERQHPYSVWATKSQIMAAYAHYLDNAYDESIIAAKRFIELHPGSRDVAYAYYLVSLSYYEQISDVGRDQLMTQRALEELETVIRRFPQSDYARDAALKIDLTRDHLAGKEMSIGRYYQKRAQFVAAINRYRQVIESFQTTTHVPEALHRLTECYFAMGIVEEAQTAAAVLGHNYPGNEWYGNSYALLTGADLLPAEDEDSWISQVWSSLY